eukprot:Amastigsp_a680616_17.p2 type:complete len:171 gc:universal Amastigsp_a680616_17:357-869(+)
MARFGLVLQGGRLGRLGRRAHALHPRGLLGRQRWALAGPQPDAAPEGPLPRRLVRRSLDPCRRRRHRAHGRAQDRMARGAHRRAQRRKVARRRAPPRRLQGCRPHPRDLLPNGVQRPRDRRPLRRPLARPLPHRPLGLHRPVDPLADHVLQRLLQAAAHREVDPQGVERP